MNGLISTLFRFPLLNRLIPTQLSCLKSALADCTSVLDIGCGPSSPLQYCPHITDSTGVEPFGPYMKLSHAQKIHTRYLDSKIQDLDFPADSFDAVIMIEVLEHLSKKDALIIIDKASVWAKKKIIVTTPNGFVSQKALDGNPLQKHLSGWDLLSLKKLGFQSRGLAGLKILRTEVQNPSMADDLTVSIKYHPRLFWFVIASLSQIITYHFPALAFELFSLKNIK